MPKTLIIYFSRTGNTKKVAEAMFETLDGEKALQPMDEGQNIDAYDLVFVGFPVQSHSIPYKVETFLKRIPPNKKIALFSTHGALRGHRLSKEAIEYAAVLTSKARVLGTFSCRGKISLHAREALNKSPEHREWAEMAASASTHPDETDLAEAKTFARQVKMRSAQGTN